MGFLLPCLLLVVALAVLRMGVRGRRVGAHPICRKCGFDLICLPRGRHVCSECGADLWAGGAFEVGRREWRPGVVILSLSLLLPALAWGGTEARRVMRGLRIAEYKPVWWLARDTLSGNRDVQVMALAELGARIGQGKLSADEVGRLVDRGLALQADMTRPWMPAWGDFIEMMQSAGKLQKEKLDLYLKQAMVFELKARPRVSRGAALPMRLTLNWARAGSRSNYHVYADGKSMQVSGVSCRAGRISIPAMGVFTGILRGDDPAMRQLKNGPQTLKLTLDVEVHDGYPAQGKMLLRTNVDLSADWMLVAERTVERRPNPRLREQVEKSLRASYMLLEEEPDERRLIAVIVRVDRPPADLAYTIRVRTSGTEQLIGSGAWRAGQTVDEQVGEFELGLGEETFDLVFRPSIGASERTVDVTEIWDGDIVVKAVAREEDDQSEGVIGRASEHRAQ